MRLSGMLGALALGNMVLAFAYQWFVVTSLGAGPETDALVAAMVLPQLVLAVFSASLTQVLVPLLATTEDEHFSDAACGFLCGVGGCGAALALLLMVTATIWVHWIVPGFGERLLELTVELTRIQLAAMVFILGGAVLTAVGHARQRFLWAEGGGALANAAGLAFLAWGLPRFGIVAAAWGLFLRHLLQGVLLLPLLGGWQTPRWAHVPWAEAWRRLRPLVVGTAYYRTDPLVDRILTSLAAPGSMTLLHLAQQLYNAGITVLAKALAAPMIPVQARHAAAGRWREFARTLGRYVAGGGVLLLVGWLTILAGGRELLAVFFAGRLGAEDVERFWWLLVLLGGMWLGGGLGNLSSGAFYARGDTKTPTRIGIVTYTLYLPLKVWVFLRFGLGGLALAISGFYLVNLALQFYCLGVFRRFRISHADP